MSKEKLWKTFTKHREPLLTTGWPSWEQKVKKCQSFVYIIGGVSHFCPSHLCSWCCACVYNTKQFKSTTSPKTTAKFTSCDQSNKHEGCTVVLLGDPNKPWHFSFHSHIFSFSLRVQNRVIWVKIWSICIWLHVLSPRVSMSAAASSADLITIF